MTVHELQQEILRLKREKNICILAHAYQSQPVLEVADYTGDSYGLSVQAAKTNADGVITVSYTHLTLPTTSRV